MDTTTPAVFYLCSTSPSNCWGATFFNTITMKEKTEIKLRQFLKKECLLTDTQIATVIQRLPDIIAVYREE